MSNEDSPYNIGAIRKLLCAAFTAEELQRFCIDRPTFRWVVDRFGPGHGLEDIADIVVLFCLKRELLSQLLAEVEGENPRMFARYATVVGSPSHQPRYNTESVVATDDAVERGVQWYERGDRLRAEVAFRRAIGIHEQVFGPDDLEVAIDLMYLGAVQIDLDHLDGARTTYERAACIYEQAYGPDCVEISLCFNNLGIVLKMLGKLPEARAAFEKALGILESYPYALAQDVSKQLEDLSDA